MFNHIAIESNNKEKSILFFSKILDIPNIYNFTISAELAKDIFGIPEN